jgi:Zn-dependent M16 (insulinase) family peptidase
VAEMEKRLSEEQSTKETAESLSCLPTLQMDDIPLKKPVYKVHDQNVNFFLKKLPPYIEVVKDYLH